MMVDQLGTNQKRDYIVNRERLFDKDLSVTVLRMVHASNPEAVIKVGKKQVQ